MKTKEHKIVNNIELKHCYKCGQWKSLDSFHKWKSKVDGLDTKCKQCKDEYRIANKEKYTAAVKRYREKHPDRILEYVRTHKQAYVEYRNSHKKQISKTKSTYQIKKRNKNIEFHILCSLRTRLMNAVRRNSNGKYDSTIKLLGCDINEFKQYIETLFDENMSWNNYGSYWEIDHIIPCRAFDLSNIEQQRKCFHYTNMQPLEKHINRSKNDTLPNGIRARMEYK